MDSMQLINDWRDGYNPNLSPDVIRALNLPIDMETGEEIKPTTGWARKVNGRFVSNYKLAVNYGNGIKIT